MLMLGHNLICFNLNNNQSFRISTAYKTQKGIPQFEQHNEVQFVNNLIHFSVTQCLILIHMRSEQV